MRTRLAGRRGNPPASENGHERLFSLEEIA
jgi:hypothetical protein